MTNEVFLLGAGFSKSISASMPLMYELGEQVVERLGDNRPYTPSGLDPSDFESWLSYLSEDQPWLLSEESYRNKSGFLRVSRTIAETVTELENRAKSEEFPAWLRSLVAYWHETKSTVITFNYDMLVESAYEETVRVTSRGQDMNYAHARQITTAPVTPIKMRFAGVLGTNGIKTFRLIKLHGSRGWLYSGRESFFGENIYDLGDCKGWRPTSVLEETRALAVDKVPFVVPPTVGKSNFFNNETVRSQWAEAFRALLAADHVYIVGYSFPQTDMMIRYLFQETHRPTRSITVVNPSRSTHDRLASIIASANLTEPITGSDAVTKLASLLSPSTPEPEVSIRD